MKYYEISVSEELSLKRLEYKYAYDIVDGMQDPEVYRNTLKVPSPYTLQDALDFIGIVKEFERKNKVQKDWSVVFEGKMIGGIGLLYEQGVNSHVSEIGYWLHKDFRGKGWMTAIVTAFAKAVFKESDLTKLKATVYSFNKASQRVLQKANFHSEGESLKAYKKDDVFIDAHVYARLKA